MKESVLAPEGQEATVTTLRHWITVLSSIFFVIDALQEQSIGREYVIDVFFQVHATDGSDSLD